VGTSLGAGAIGNLICRVPERFQRMVWLLPAGLDLPFGLAARHHLLAEDLEGKTSEEALESVLNDPARVAEYVETPWRLELNRVTWQHDDPDGLSRAIHGVVEDWPIPDRELLRDVRIPTIIVTIEGDEIHPAELGPLFAELLPNAELIALQSQEELLRRIPEIVVRVSGFIAGAG
jgi:pimeloyl-ACP methyl ester carboxylesterase